MDPLHLVMPDSNCKDCRFIVSDIADGKLFITMHNSNNEIVDSAEIDKADLAQWLCDHSDY